MLQNTRIFVLALVAVLVLSVAVPVSAKNGRASSDEAIKLLDVSVTRGKGAIKELKAALNAGQAVFLEGGSEVDLEEALDVKLQVRLAQSVTPDKGVEVPLKASAVGVARRNDGSLHMIHYIGPVSKEKLVGELRKVSGLSLNSVPGDVSPQVVVNNPNYNLPRGSVIHDFAPYGSLTSSWDLSKTDNGAESIWIVKRTDQVNPGRALNLSGNSRYGLWVTRDLKPEIQVAFAGENLIMGEPGSSPATGSFSVTLGYQTAEASWSWDIQDVQVFTVCDPVNLKKCSWDFNYFAGGTAQGGTTMQIPGIVATNSSGPFMVYNGIEVYWENSKPWGQYKTTTSSYTLTVPDR